MKTKIIFVLAFTLFISTSLLAQIPFITTWNTENSGVSNNDQITIPTIGEGYNYNIYWEDTDNPEINGSLRNETGSVTITFPAPGIYRVEISGDFPRIYFNNSGDRFKIRTIDQWGDNSWTSMENAFYGCSGLSIQATDSPDLSGVRDMAFMFAGAFLLNSDIGDWATGNVTNMSGMFADARSFNQDIGSWDVSNVTNMSGIFFRAVSFNQDIGDWDVGKVTNMASMFFAANAFNQNIGRWDVGNVTNMSSMLSASFVFNQDIGSWDVSNVTNMASMFNSAFSFNQNIGEWNVGNVTDMNRMFQAASSFNQNIGSWDVSNVTDMSFMFSEAQLFNQDIGGWDMSNVKNAFVMFNDARAFNQDIGDWNVSNMTNLSNMFNGAISFNQNIGGWDVSNATSMSDMFINVSLSSCNYDSLLIGWSKLNLQNDVNFHAGNSPYSTNGAAARQLIINDFDWKITDGNKFETGIAKEISCAGLSDGVLESNVNGSHKWFNESEELLSEEKTLTGVAVGEYTLEVDFGTGCIYSETINITEPDAIEILGTVEATDIKVEALGGTGTYTFSWEGPNEFSSDEANISADNQGEYIITVTDENDCEAMRTFQVITTNTVQSNKLNVDIFPNPATSHFYVQTDYVEVRIIKLYDSKGKLVASVDVNHSNLKTVDISHLREGVYIYMLSDVNGIVLKTDKLNIVK